MVLFFLKNFFFSSIPLGIIRALCFAVAYFAIFCIFISSGSFGNWKWPLEKYYLSVVFHGPDSNTSLKTSTIAMDFRGLLGQMTEAISVCAHFPGLGKFLCFHYSYLSLQKGSSKCRCAAKTERGLGMVELLKQQSAFINRLCLIRNSI